MEKTDALNIFEFTDYRTFLKSFFQLRKKERPDYSLGIWSKQLGLSSTAVLVNVLNGKRNAGKAVAEKLTDYFKFNTDEKQYFEDLICLSKVVDDPRLSLALMEKISRYHPKGEFKLLDDKAFSSISKWYYYVIKEMVRHPNFKEDTDWISKRLEYEVQPREVKKALSDLIDLKILYRNKAGDLRLATRDIRTTTDITSEAIKRFHEQALENANTSLRKHNLQERDFSARTLSIKEENIPYLKQLIKEFRDRATELFDESSESSRVYQINLQLIPMTKGASNEN